MATIISCPKPVTCIAFLILLMLQHAAWTTYISSTLDHSTNADSISLRAKFVWDHHKSKDADQRLSDKSNALWVSPYPPLSCRMMLRDVQEKSDSVSENNLVKSSDVGVVTDVNKGVGHFRLTTTQRDSMKGIPPFWVSLHKPEVDPVRWCIMTYGQYYETRLTEAIHKTLIEYSPSDAMFIDVGGNIGWFSLLARSLGYEVAVFEPNPINQLRLCQSLQLNDWLHEAGKIREGDGPPVNLYPYGVGDQHGSKLVLKQVDEVNPGSGTFKKNAPRTQNASHNQDQTIMVVSLDEIAIQNGWISPVDGRALPGAKVIAFMKVDVEGFESFVFKGAQKLLFQSKLVKNIAIEWNGKGYLDRSTKKFDLNSAKKRQTYDNDPIVQLTKLGKGPYELYRMGGYLGPNISGQSKRKQDGQVPPTDENLVKELAELFGTSRHAANLWFRLREDEVDKAVEK